MPESNTEFVKDYRAKLQLYIPVVDRRLINKGLDACDRLEQLSGNTKHPENYCHLCGGKNINWYADNELWNRVVDSPAMIICPICFVKMAEQKNVKPTSWRISQEGDAPEVNQLRLKAVNLSEQIEQQQECIRDLLDYAVRFVRFGERNRRLTFPVTKALITKAEELLK